MKKMINRSMKSRGGTVSKQLSSDNCSQSKKSLGNLQQAGITQDNLVYDQNLSAFQRNQRNNASQSVINVHQHFNQPNIMNFNGTPYRNSVLSNTQYQNLIDTRPQTAKLSPEAMRRMKKDFASKQSRGVISAISRNNNRMDRLVKDNFRQVNKSTTAVTTKDLTCKQSHKSIRSQSRLNLLKRKQMNHKQQTPDGHSPLNSVEQQQYLKLGGFNPDAIMRSFQYRKICASPFQSSPAKGSKTQKNSTANNKKKVSDFFNKEDMYDQLMENKSNLNQAQEEVTRLKTRLAFQSDQNKSKDKFIEDLVRQTYALSNALDSPDEMQHQQSVDQQLDKFMQNFMKKGPFKVLKMKKQIAEMNQKMERQSLYIKSLEQNMKSTQLKELQEEVRLYKQECLRLKKIAETNLMRGEKIQIVDEDPNKDEIIITQMKEQVGREMKNNRDLQRIIKLKDSVIQEKDQQIQQMINQIQKIQDNTSVNISTVPDQKIMDQNQQLQDQLQNKNDLIADQESQIKNYLQQIESLEKKLSEEANSSKLNENSDFQRLQSDLIKMNREYIELQEVVKKLQVENQQQINQISELNAINSKLKEENSNLVSTNKSLTDNLQQSLKNASSYQNQNTYLMKEIQMIEEKLQNVNIEDVDERSDILSRMQTILKRDETQISDQSYLSPTRIKRSGTILSKQVQRPSLIIEDPKEQNEETHRQKDQINQIEPELGKNDSRNTDNASDLMQIQKDVEAKATAQEKKIAFLSNIGRSQSNVDQSSFAFQREQFGKQKTQKRNNLLEQIDNVPDESYGTLVTEDIISVAPRAQNNVEMEFVERTDPCVQLGLEVLDSIQQILRINLDQIEKYLFDGNFQASKKVNIINLTSILMQNLGLSEYQATRFARFLIEEKDESNPDAKVNFDPVKKIDSQLVIVRLMAHSSYPCIYDDNKEEETKTKFISVLYDDFPSLVKELTDLDQKIVTKTLFKNTIRQYDRNNQLTDEDIDCAFIMLCRQVKFEDIDQLSKREIIRGTHGFDAQTIQNILFQTHIRLPSSRKTCTDSQGSGQISPHPITPVLGSGNITHETSDFQTFQNREKIEKFQKSNEKRFTFAEEQVDAISPKSIVDLQEVQRNLVNQEGDEDYSDSRSETDFDMQKSMKLTVIKQESDGKSIKLLNHYEQNDIAIIREQANNTADIITRNNQMEDISFTEQSLKVEQQSELKNKNAKSSLTTETTVMQSQTKNKEMISSMVESESNHKTISAKGNQDLLAEEDEHQVIANYNSIVEVGAPNDDILKIVTSLNTDSIQNFTIQKEEAKPVIPATTPYFDSNQRANFSTIQEYQLKQDLQNFLHQKIDDSLQTEMNSQSVVKVIDFTAEVIKSCANTVLEKAFILKAVLKQHIHILKIENEEDRPVELEVLKPSDFVKFLDYLLERPLEFDQRQCILTIFSMPQYAGLILVKEIMQSFADLGIEDGIPKNQEHLSFTGLDMKSIRILNRLNAYLQRNQLDIKQLFAGIIQKQVVKTKTSSPEIEIIQQTLFFEKLAEAGIKKSSKVYEPLCQHIYIDKKYPQFLMFKKLKRYCNELQKSVYFSSFGLNKRKLDFEAYMLEQYEIENNGGSTVSITNVNGPQNEVEYSSNKLHLRKSITNKKFIKQNLSETDQEMSYSIEKTEESPINKSLK